MPQCTLSLCGEHEFAHLFIKRKIVKQAVIESN